MELNLWPKMVIDESGEGEIRTASGVESWSLLLDSRVFKTPNEGPYGAEPTRKWKPEPYRGDMIRDGEIRKRVKKKVDVL